MLLPSSSPLPQSSLISMLLLLLLGPTSTANRLHSAAAYGHVEIVQDLLASTDRTGLIPGCDCWMLGWWCEPCGVDDSHRGGMTATMYAALEGHTPILRMLLEAGSDADEVNVQVCLLCARLLYLSTCAPCPRCCTCGA